MGVFDFIFGANGQTSTIDRHAQPWLLNALLGNRKHAGVRVTPTSALTLGTYFACIRNIAEDLAAMPLGMFEVTDEDSRERLQDDPTQDILREDFNTETTAQAGRETLLFDAMGAGGGFAEIERYGAGRPRYLHPIPRHLCDLVRHEGRLHLLVLGQRNAQGEVTPHVLIPYEDVFHVKGIAADGINGLSVAQMGAREIGTAIARESYAANFYANNAQVGGVIEWPKKLDKEQVSKLRVSWIETYGGENSWAPAILESGAKWHPNAVPQKDAQFVESDVRSAIHVCRWFRMPPSKVGELQRATYANREQDALEYQNSTLTPWAVRIEKEARRKMLTTAQRASRRFYFKHNFENLLRGDYVTRTTGHRTLIHAGVMSINEARAIEDLPRRVNAGDDDAAADRLWLQGGMSTIEQLAESGGTGAVKGSDDPGGGTPNDVPQDTGESGDDDAGATALLRDHLFAHGPTVADALARASKREAAEHKRARTALGGDDLDGYLARAARFYKRHARVIETYLTSAIDGLSATVAAFDYTWSNDPHAILTDECDRLAEVARLAAVEAYKTGRPVVARTDTTEDAVAFLRVFEAAIERGALCPTS